MHRPTLKAALAIAILVLTSCGVTPPSETGKKAEARKPPIPPGPITGRTAFWEMYKSAHAWTTDLTPLALVLATQCEGTVLIHEKLFESRLFFVDSLIAMGARILLSDPHRALVIGPSRLHGATIVSPDIRAGMALIAAALAAQGRSVIRNVQQVDRGYERIGSRLKALGARITRE